jgi:hypothetical protein
VLAGTGRLKDERKHCDGDFEVRTISHRQQVGSWEVALIVNSG